MLQWFHIFMIQSNINWVTHKEDFGRRFFLFSKWIKLLLQWYLIIKRSEIVNKFNKKRFVHEAITEEFEELKKGELIFTDFVPKFTSILTLIVFECVLNETFVGKNKKAIWT